MLIVGLTGGIGSGKTTAAEYFADRGVPVIDADGIARELVAPGEPALQKVLDTFGHQYLAPDGQLDRARLREAVFSDDAMRGELEALLHPLVREAILHHLATLDAEYCIVVIPLLLESGQIDLVDRILVVECPLELRYQRLSLRDSTTRQQVDRIRATQMDSRDRVEAADDIIHNDSDREALQEQVEELHNKYRALAGTGE